MNWDFAKIQAIRLTEQKHPPSGFSTNPQPDGALRL